MKCTQQELARVLSEAAFLKPFGMALYSCAPGECVVRVPFSPSLERPGGIVSGIALMGAADVAMWLVKDEAEAIRLDPSLDHYVSTKGNTASIALPPPSMSPYPRPSTRDALDRCWITQRLDLL
ncbi:MAG: hypothetical protein WA803_14855 [Steroidobacteraceae bacterium]